MVTPLDSVSRTLLRDDIRQQCDRSVYVFESMRCRQQKADPCRAAMARTMQHRLYTSSLQQAMQSCSINGRDRW